MVKYVYNSKNHTYLLYNLQILIDTPYTIFNNLPLLLLI